jgi:hypothetical protein
VQQPLQEVESHTQAAEEQCSPAGQLAVPPQVQAPLAHVRPVWVQSMQAAPPVPHVVFPETSHTPVLVQQPLGHDDALQTHTPARHS